MSPLAVVAVASAGLAAAALAGLVVPPRARLARRVRPYTVVSRTALGDRRDLAVADRVAAQPRLSALVARLHRLLEPTSDVDLAARLRRAGMFTDLPADERPAAYRSRQLLASLTGAALGGVAPTLAGMGPAGAVAGVALGTVIGATRCRSRVERAVRQRRERVQIELYTIDQLLAMHARAGAGVAQMLRRVAGRSHGIVAGELAEVLAAHRGGRPLPEALGQAARDTVEPQAARTYRLLASGAAYGTDLAESLRQLGDDVRGQRAEALRRTATRRRAAMLVPTVAILAPIMLLFIGAPLPSIVLGGLP